MSGVCVGQGHLWQLSGNLQGKNYILWAYKKLGGTKEALQEQRIILFSMEKKMKIT